MVVRLVGSRRNTLRYCALRTAHRDQAQWVLPCTCTEAPILMQVSLPGSCTKPGPKAGQGFACLLSGSAVAEDVRVGGLGLVKVCACRLAVAKACAMSAAHAATTKPGRTRGAALRAGARSWPDAGVDPAVMSDRDVAGLSRM